MKYKTIHFEEIDSTNTYLKNHYLDLDDFTFVSSDFQSHGKGRNDRTWLSPAKSNLMFSILLKNNDTIRFGGFLSLATAFSISKTIEKLGFDKVSIKWPNDVYIDSKKVCGILLESQLPNYIVIGVGINVNQKEFKGEFRHTPTSLFLEKQKEFVIEEIKPLFFDELFNNLNNIELRKDEFIKYFNEHNFLLDKEVRFINNQKEIKGIVKGIDDNFALIISSNNEEIFVSSGEISLQY